MFRTFGWVQNPSSFKSLKKAIRVFDAGSHQHSYLKENLSNYVTDVSKKTELLNALTRTPLILSYNELVGTGYSPRASAPCDGIIQASIPSQNVAKPYIDDWSSDGFLRWAHCLGFVKYHYENDHFSITNIGIEFSRSVDGSEQEEIILVDAMLAYPPATRILELLSEEGAHLTKFEIGSQLGFSGEDGFTSLPQSVLIDYLFSTVNVVEKNKIRSDWEGTADKYARMISGWLTKLGLLKNKRKYFTIGSETEYIGHAYKITGKGFTKYRGSKGMSSHSKIKKNVFWEMFATKGKNREYVRTRRSTILAELQKTNSYISIATLKDVWEKNGFSESIKVLEKDIQGINNCGIRIENSNDNFKLQDDINSFIIPAISITEELKDKELENKKEELLNTLSALPSKYIGLIEIALDGQQNRPLEMSVIELIRDVYGFNAVHMGGGRKPDGGAYIRSTSSYDLILDTKAYSRGYSLPINQADSMVRYIEEYKEKDSSRNSNIWWEYFPKNSKAVYYLFISSYFTGSYQQRLDNIRNRTQVEGGVISIENLLYGANYFLEGKMSFANFESLMKTTELIIKGKY